MLCENPKTNVAAINSRKSRGKFKNLFLVRIITDITFNKYFCHSGLDRLLYNVIARKCNDRSNLVNYPWYEITTTPERRLVMTKVDYDTVLNAGIQ